MKARVFPFLVPLLLTPLALLAEDDYILVEIEPFAGWEQCMPTAINATGTVAGYCTQSMGGTRRAFRYKDGQMLDRGVRNQLG